MHIVLQERCCARVCTNEKMKVFRKVRTKVAKVFFFFHVIRDFKHFFRGFENRYIFICFISSANKTISLNVHVSYISFQLTITKY